MENLSEQEQVRRQSLQAMRDMGIDPYPAAEYEVTGYSTDIKKGFVDRAEGEPEPEAKWFTGKQVRIAGRLMSKRIMGKASFIEIQDSKGRIQVYVSRDDIQEAVAEGEAAPLTVEQQMYNVVFKKLLDIGDFIGIEGFVFRTQMGEISVHAKKLTVLAKSLKPLPIVKYKDGVAYDGFNDPEQRYRQRYVDLVVNEGVKDTFLKRAAILRTMRQVFDEAGYTEVETPILQQIAGGASARPFITHHNSLDVDMYLRIATELYLKRLIVGGFEGVYEIGRNFRNEGMDRNHNPEFTCMELYVQYKDYNWMMSFTEQLLEKIALAVNGSTKVQIGDHEVDFKAPYRRLPILDAIKEKTGLDLASMDEDALTATTRVLYPDAEAFEKDMPRLLQKMGFDAKEAQSIASHIVVEPARGSGHAWPSLGRKEEARLRTRIPASGMDYKGYNIAVHEFGHCVEQVLDMYEIDHYLLSGVPNTAYTEASAFLWQHRDLQLLPQSPITNHQSQMSQDEVFDQFWSMYEIMGVSLVDMQMWQWIYAHPKATPKELCEATQQIAKEIWNRYYEPVLGEHDCILLAVYSHMVNAPMYLPNYPLGHIVQYQLEEHLAQYKTQEEFANEYARIYRLGRLTPKQWMIQAVGEAPSIEPILRAVDKLVRP